MAVTSNAEDRGTTCGNVRACRLCATFGESQPVQNCSETRRSLLRMAGKFSADNTKNTYKNMLLKKCNSDPRGELSYLAPLGSENISAPYFKQCFFRGGRVLPPRQSNTTPPSPKTEITNILFYILNFSSIIKFKM